MVNDGKPITIRIHEHKHRKNGKVDTEIIELKTILPRSLPVYTSPKFLKGGIREHGDEDYIEQLNLTISFLQILPYDKFEKLICNAAAQLKHYPEDYDLYELRDIDFLSFFCSPPANKGDFISTLLNIGLLLLYLTTDYLRQRPAIYKPPERVEKIQKAFGSALKFLRDAVCMQCVGPCEKKVGYHCGLPQTTAWQSFVDFKNSFCGNDYTVAKQLRENTETQPDLDTDTPLKLREFMQVYCEPLTPNLLESRAKALYSSHQRKPKVIELKHISSYKRGQAKVFQPSYLKKMWPKYQKECPTLPSLK